MTALEPGAVVGKDFRVVRPLSSGGMGSVYVVEQLSIGALRALKLMAPALVRNARARERFVREARVAAQIESDHVVEVITAGVDEALGVPFLVMELLRGAELGVVMERLGALPLGDVAELIAQLGHALACAHERGIVHRDLKPENIFLALPRRRDAAFTAKILDFGIAKLVADGGGTQAVGTPLYMPPEQTARGGVVAPAADVWSLGLIAFQLLVGRAFWRSTGDALPELMREILLEPIPVASVRASELGRVAALPPGFDDWFARCVQRELAKRFASAGVAVRAFSELVFAGAAAGAIARLLSSEEAPLASSESAVTVPASSEGAPAAAAPSDRPPPHARVAALAPLIVGRDHELRSLEALLAALGGGSGAVAFVIGEPGIGKSRLASEVADRALSLGCRVVWGRCWEGAGAPAFWPWIQVLRTLAHDGASLGTLARLLPESGASNEAAPADRFEVFDGLARLLSAAAARKPLVVLLEDLHDADLTSLSALEFVVRHTREAPLLIVGTYRNVAARVSQDAAALLERAARFATILPLSRLTEADVAALGGMDAETARTVHRATEGNPLFVHEILRVRSVLGPGRLPVPNGIRAAIREHVRVAGGVDAPLELAAILGREFSLRSIAAVLDRDPIAVAGSLEPAVREGLLNELLPRQYRFTHVLIRDTLYDDLAPARRAELHLLAAERLARLHAGDPAAPLDEIAHHYFEAGPSSIDAAIDASRRAADRAIRMLAFEQAAAGLERALGALEAAAPGDARRRAELAIELGRARILSGNAEAGMDACRQAVALARSIGSAELLARAALTFGQIYTPGVPGGELTALLEEAIAALAERESSLRARALARLAGALQPGPTPDRPIALARESIEMARRLADEEALLYALRAGGSALFNVVDPRECIPLHQELLRLCLARGDVATALHARTRLFTDHLNLGDVAAADVELAAYEAAAEKLAQPRYHWPAALMRASRAQLQGHFSENDRQLADARRLTEAAGDRFAQLAVAASELQAQRLRGRLELPVPAELMPAFAPIPGAAALFGIPRVAGNEALTRSALLAAPEESLARWSATWTAFGVWVADSALFAGDAELMTKVYDWLLPVAGRNGAWGGAGMCCEGPVSRWLSRLAAKLGRWDDAERHYQDALSRATRMGMRPFVAQLQCEWASELARLGRLDEAARAFGEGRALAEALEMTELLARWPHAPAAPLREIRMTREGEVWLVEGEGEQCRVKDSRGLQMLAQLLDHPERELHCLELGGGKGAVDVADAGAALDARARDEYRARLRELRAEADDAESCHDTGRAERARHEIEFLERELARALGIGGRERKPASASERARINVQRRVKLAIEHIGQHAPALARRLTETIRTGTFCAYEPNRPRRA